MIMRAAALTVALAIPVTGANAQSVELRPGVILDAASDRVYVMRSADSIECIELKNGKSIWLKSEIGKPVAVAGDALIAQIPPAKDDWFLTLMVLNGRTGEMLDTDAIALPPGINAQVLPDAGMSFTTAAYVLGEDAIIRWSQQTREVRGQWTRDDRGKELAFDSGLVRFDVGTRKLELLEQGRAPGAALKFFDPAETPVGLEPGTRLSIDGRHTLRSKRIAGDGEWLKYEWSIEENATGKQIGAIKSHLSQSSFLVQDRLILFDVGEYTRRIDGEMIHNPLRVHAANLNSGEIVWMREVQDTEFRAPYPP